MPGEEQGETGLGVTDHHEEVKLLLCHSGWEENVLHLDDSRGAFHPCSVLTVNGQLQQP